MNRLASLLLRVKPVSALLLLRDKSKKWNISALAKQVDTTYPHMLHLVKTFEELGIVKTTFSGRSRYVKLTEYGDELAHDLEGLLKHIERSK